MTIGHVMEALLGKTAVYNGEASSTSNAKNEPHSAAGLQELRKRRAAALEHPLVKATLDAFPGANVSVPRDKTGGGPTADDHDTLSDRSEDNE